MSRDFVRSRADQMLALMKQERALRVELAALDFSMCSEAELRTNLRRQRQLLARIDGLRQQQMLPIVRSMLDFISSRTKRVPSVS